jgi:hypothetical protein
MDMKRILLVLLCVLSMPVMASHIVGGEFEVIHLSDYNYRINLILYFDILNGSPGARDFNFTATIYRKSDNAWMQDVYFESPAESPVNYTQPECSSGELVTSKLLYSRIVTLDPARYNHPQGYYIVWERCCRNYTITNIYSEDPAISGRAAGQTFYLEFPPVVKNGEQFINSSPRLFPPLNDYACPRKPYYVDFAGTDDDGDSLVYSLVTPLSTHSIIAFPPVQPAPYPLVQWRSPFHEKNIIGGLPDLRISADGFLTTTPQQQGLFVFAVRCDEYRDGVKIGEVRRDFQMLVVDVCPVAEPPQILGKKLTDAGFAYDNTMSVTFNSTDPDEQRCIEVQVSDPDASNQDDNFQENVSIRAIPLGFKQNVRGILPTVSNAVLSNGSVSSFQICFPECPYVEGPFAVGIVAYDDACSLPLSDTLKVTVNIIPPPNTNPYFTTPDVTEVVMEGDKRIWPIMGFDDDGDNLSVYAIPGGFSLEDFGMKLVRIKLENGEYQAQLEWDTRCDVFDFTTKSQFELTILLEDEDYCNFSHPALMKFNLQVLLPGNADPVIDSDLTPDPHERDIFGITRKVNESLKFNVTGIDPDNDFIVLSARGIGFDIDDLDVTFNPASGNGGVASQFVWNIFCDGVNLAVKKHYTFEFIVVDNANKCRFYKADTLDVTVSLEPPDNNGPTLVVSSLNQSLQMVNNSLTVELGQQITLGLSGTDPDLVPLADWLRLDLIEIDGSVEPEGYVFSRAEGRGNVSTTFTWNPECNIFQDGVYENTYTFTFNLVDDRCFNRKGDTVAVDITIKDVDRTEGLFEPPNIITPNGDHLNEFFAMVRMDDITGELVSILPKDNCVGRFEGVAIYNRWGEQVFASIDRDFRWFAEGASAGVYFYHLKFSDREYKGTVTVAFSESQSYR